MASVFVRDTIVNLDHVMTVKFVENDPSVSHDDRCSIVLTDGSTLEIYGSDAEQSYRLVAEGLGMDLSTQ